ncbi:MAG: 50S ribosomal protein L31 [Anaerolineaceae bacterium]|nr:50S ribosomal protein L31 [Anaerolineaceae bacterium]
MKKDIHPEYFTDATVTCACGNTWQTGSTKKAIRTEICSKCHPFFTGQQQRLIDIEGQVDRFYRRLQARKEYVDQKSSKQAERTSPDRPISELKLSKRSVEALSAVGLTTCGQIMDKLADGEKAILEIDGFGRKSLIDMKKQLRQLGYDLPEAANEIVV